MIRTLGLSHINLNVFDIDRSVRFYQQVFGLELLHDYEGPMGPHPIGRQVILSTPGALDLIALTHVPGDPIGPAGVGHFGFTLADNSDVDRAVEEVERAGGTLVRRGVAEIEGTVEHFAYVRDPDGYVLELNAQKILLNWKQKRSG